MRAQPFPADRLSEPERFPSAEELRMIRAIVLLTLDQAARHGEYRASFHGFRVSAQRRAALRRANDPVELEVCVSLEERVLQRIRVTFDATPERPIGHLSD